MFNWYGIFAKCCNSQTIQIVKDDMGQCQKCSRVFFRKDDNV